MTTIQAHTRIRRPLFAIAALEKPGSISYHFMKSNAPGGILRSGKPFARISSLGELRLCTSSEGIADIEELLRGGWRDQLDPGYNT